MCGVSFRAVHLLKEHALDIHGIKGVVVKEIKWKIRCKNVQ
jgi:hypothetical protein